MSSDLQRTVKSLVKPQYCGHTLLEYLSERFNYNSPAEWQEIVDEKRLCVNGRPASCDELLKENDLLEYRHLDHPEPEVDFNFDIIHRTDDFLLINKTGNLPVHPAGPFFHHTLWAALKKEGFEPRFINRLDRETSGLVLAALHKDSASKLGRQIQSRSIYKEYLAIVEGHFPASIEARGYLEKDSASAIDKKLLFHKDDDFSKHGKKGVDSSFELVENFGGLSLLKCVIRTGKMHQIRATLHTLGFPLAGDKIYGVNEEYYLKFIRKKLEADDMQKLRLSRQALHAHVLKFKDPESGETLEFSCELPADLKEVLKK